MSVLFLVGNGFDLNCGMRTKYKDVYEKYIKTDSPNRLIEYFKKSISKQYDKWGDFEMAMAKMFGPLFDDINLFMECVTDFTVFLCDHLKKQEETFFSQLRDSKTMEVAKGEMLRSFCHFYEGITNNITNTIKGVVEGCVPHVISFNYTEVFDKLYKSLFPQDFYNVIHIHGKVDEPVIGIDNKQQINAKFKDSYKFIRGFVKPDFNEFYDSNRVKQAKKEFIIADVICVFGMSLGESDLTWRKQLIDWLQTGDKELILYDYSASQADARTVFERIDKEEARKNELFHRWGIDDLKEIKQRIHIPVGKNIFNIKEEINNSKLYLQKIRVEV